MHLQKKLMVASIVAASLVTTVFPASSSTFHPWQVHGVAWNDLLNVRQHPTSQSAALTGYPNGVVLMMTGACTKGLHLDDVANLPSWKKRSAVRYRWCQVWFSPGGNAPHTTGWVYGKYIRPGI